MVGRPSCSLAIQSWLRYDYLIGRPFPSEKLADPPVPLDFFKVHHGPHPTFDNLDDLLSFHLGSLISLADLFATFRNPPSPSPGAGISESVALAYQSWIQGYIQTFCSRTAPGAKRMVLILSY